MAVKKKVVFGLALTALLALLLAVTLRKPQEPERANEGVTPAASAGRIAPRAPFARNTAARESAGKARRGADGTAVKPVGAKSLSSPRAATRRTAENAPRGQGPAFETPAAETLEKAEAIRKVEAWEAMIDELAESAEAPAADRVMQTRDMFMGLNKADQMNAITTALHLLPDEQFPVLYALLFDKTQEFELLDEIFSDALNRPEEIKVPLMKLLMKDKEHPLAKEAERILDATGELDEEES